MTVTASALRADIYKLLDRVLETGEPLEILRNGRVLRIEPEQPKGWLHKIKPSAVPLGCAPDELLGFDGEALWDPFLP